ncbi:protocadherin gamma-A4-like [Alligator sinensis]|uniref:Protocadherin gamma-A4-like n=1 Tax=Alligator sinensis TaxID=38654 RepID=A0A1U8DQF2_ALLSI|nr:protocadherin gamma-A4-like [Alligator sinensis]
MAKAQRLRRCAGRAVLCCVVLTVCGAAAAGQIRYSIPEEMQKGSFVGNIAQDLGLEAKALSERGVRVVSTGRTQYFALNVKSGHLITAERLDREQLCGRAEKCVINCEIIAEDRMEVFITEVELTDVNDHAPSFQEGKLEFRISETTAVGTRYSLEEAQDPDVGINSIRDYQLSSNEHFSLHVQAGAAGDKYPELVLEKPLDREEQAAHDLILTATDGGDPVRSGTARIHVVVLDANDNAPVFSQPLYRVSVRENVPVGSALLTVSATDADEELNAAVAYSLRKTKDKASETFQVDSRTGDIVTVGTLDYEEEAVYELEVQARDSGDLWARAKVLVTVLDVNDNAPQITVTSAVSSISEDSPPGTLVALIHLEDRDSGRDGEIMWSIPDHFRLQKSLDKYYTLVTARDLDREQVADYNVTVTARDRGAPPLWSATTIAVQVSDVNDNAPAFSQAAYSVWVSENNARGASVFCARAADADWGDNARVTYWLAEGELQGAPLSSWLSVQAESGAVHALRALDYEQVREIRFAVEARDGGGAAARDSLEDKFGRYGGDFASLWSQARNSTHCLGKCIGCAWIWTEECGELGVSLQPAPHADCVIMMPRVRTFLKRFLKDAICSKYACDLRAKPNQGKVFDVSLKWDTSNRFMLSFADLCFLLHNCLPLNGATLGHLVRAIPAAAGEISVNRRVLGCKSQMRPTIMTMNEEAKKIIIVDTTIPSENQHQAFTDAPAHKRRKYSTLANIIRAHGYDVMVDVLIVGTLRAWDPSNECILPLGQADMLPHGVPHDLLVL